MSYDELISHYHFLERERLSIIIAKSLIFFRDATSHFFIISTPLVPSKIMIAISWIRFLIEPSNKIGHEDTSDFFYRYLTLCDALTPFLLSIDRILFLFNYVFPALILSSFLFSSLLLFLSHCLSLPFPACVRPNSHAKMNSL